MRSSQRPSASWTPRSLMNRVDDDRDARERMYRAMVAYQDEGLSIEEAAERYAVSPHVMRDRMRRQSWRIRSWRETGKRRHGDSRVIPDAVTLEAASGVPAWVLAQRYGVSVRRMQEWLRERGVNGRDRFLTMRARAQADAARERVMRIVELRERGLTHGQIAVRLGYSRGYVTAAYSRYQRGKYLWQRTTTPQEETP